MDLCEKCVVRGNKYGCEQTPCNMHNSWLVEQLKAENEWLRVENERFQSALEHIATSGPVDKNGNYNPDAAWSWCYDVANSALKPRGGEGSNENSRY